jgi:hypothetical protein
LCSSQFRPKNTVAFGAKPGKKRRRIRLNVDAAREAAYDREFRSSPLSEALDKAQDYGITIVSMKRDWNVVF